MHGVFLPGAEPHVNTCYKHFYYFVTEFGLMHEKEFEPLKELTGRICTDVLPLPHPSTGGLIQGTSVAMANLTVNGSAAS